MSSQESTSPWFEISNASEVNSPSLLLYPDRIESNLRQMLAMVGDPGRLRPHIKTHKLPELIKIQQTLGIQKFKTSTVAETEMLAQCGSPDVLLAYPLVGPNPSRMAQLIQKFPKTKFSVVADSMAGLELLSKTAQNTGVEFTVWLDIDCGQHRTGVVPDSGALELYQRISSSAGLRPGGLHVYDGHIHDTDIQMRSDKCEAAFAPVKSLRVKILRSGHQVPAVVAGGTPTFPMHARHEEVECSPGTCVLWDWGYGTKLPDLKFHHAALVLTRVISKPGENRLCLDLGHKAIASENPHPRVHFLNLPDAMAIAHSEEHLVVETGRASAFAIGDCLYGVPWHICPTVALHSVATVIRKGVASEQWRITARERTLTI